MGTEELRALLEAADAAPRLLPATAQVAKQEADFLARALTQHVAAAAVNGALPPPSDDAEPAHSFKYTHRGKLAYIGAGSGVASLPRLAAALPEMALRGFTAGSMWKSFETASQFSWRNRLLVAGDLARTKLFGRDISRVV